MVVIGSRIAVQTRCLKQPTRKALHTAARLGCEGVQFDASQEVRPADMSATGLRHLRKLLDDQNLRVSSIALPSQQGYADSDGLQQRVDTALGAMRLASQLHARLLVFNLGPVPALPSDRNEVATGGPENEPHHARDDGWSALVDVLASLASHGNHLGVQLAAYAPSADPRQLQHLISELPEGALGVDLSPALLVAARGSAIDFVDVLGPHIVHVHGNDAVRDLRSHQGVEVELGRGSADYPELLGRLEEFGYRGWITLVRQYSDRQLEDLDNAVRYLRAL
jgi:sugar phosphate isomerase/epimerase